MPDLQTGGWCVLYLRRRSSNCSDMSKNGPCQDNGTYPHVPFLSIKGIIIVTREATRSLGP